MDKQFLIIQIDWDRPLQNQQHQNFLKKKLKDKMILVV